MKKCQCFILFFVAAILPFPALPYFLTGEMLKTYSESERRVASGVGETIDILNSGYYKGFISGVIDTVNGSLMCIPQSATLGDAYTQVATYLIAHSDRLREPARTLVIEALSPVYPCNPIP